jgi:hypothetical protein
MILGVYMYGGASMWDPHRISSLPVVPITSTFGLVHAPLMNPMPGTRHFRTSNAC